MARRRKGRAVNGILLLDKPVGVSSNHALQRVRGIFGAQKAGHGGTLDPFAEGLLPILLGEASKFGRFLLDADKSYDVTLQWGQETATDDHTGDVVRRAAAPSLGEHDWQTLLAHFRGEYLQTPPIYSALKIDGERAYALARKGKTPQMTPRRVSIGQLDLLEYRDSTATLRVTCSKGTYIRALIRDIGRAANSAAHATHLRRRRVGTLDGAFHTLNALSALRDAKNFAALDALLLPLDACVSPLPKAVIPDAKLRFFRNGNDIDLGQSLPAGEYAFYHDHTLLGVGKIAAGRAYPERLCAVRNATQ